MVDKPYTSNSTSYPLYIRNQLRSLANDDNTGLKYHQFLVKEYFTKIEDQRGLLICHSMGQGKTRIAVAIALHYHEYDKTRNIIVLSAKSLSDNFKKEVLKVDPNANLQEYKFVSLNSSNMFTQIKNINKSPEELEVEKKIGEFIASNHTLENSMLIIDEAHNLFNSITNGAKNALMLYDLIMRTNDIKLIFLSGTPIINHPFELVPCFNMLKGPIKTSVKPSKPSRKSARSLDDDAYYTTLFSEELDEFNEFFVDQTIKNKEKFMNRIFGLVSYYGDLYFSNVLQRDNFPEELKTIVVRVPMSQVQFAKYTNARLAELEETKIKFRGQKARFSSASGSVSSYRVKSRQISNFCIPEYALGPPTTGRKARTKHIDRITVEDLLSGEYSPKMAAIMDNLEKHRDQPGIIYSQFVSGEGIAVLALIMEAIGYQNYYSQKTGGAEEMYGISGPPKRVYAILSGDIDPDVRRRTIEVFNDVSKPIDYLLLSGAVAEGIDLKNVRHVHIMEPFWNYARINQVKTRAIRYKSHADLPEDQRNVQTYIYLSDYPENYPEKKKTEDTTDVDLYERSLKNMALIDSFMYALADSSIDCSIHYDGLPTDVQKRINCKICAPTNEPLFYPDIRRDMELPSACKPYKERSVAVKEITVNGNKYYYNADDGNINIYSYDEELGGYKKITNKLHDYYDVLAKVMDDAVN